MDVDGYQRILTIKTSKKTKNSKSLHRHHIASSKNYTQHPSGSPSPYVNPFGKSVVKKAKELKDDLPHPAWSVKYKDLAISLPTNDRLTAIGWKGWATVMLTHGANFGCWYFELILGDDEHNEACPPPTPPLRSEHQISSAEMNELENNMGSHTPEQTTFDNDEDVSSSDLDHHGDGESQSPQIKNQRIQLQKTTNALRKALEVNFTGWPRGMPKTEPHIRIGWSCRYNRLDVPLGCDYFGRTILGFALRDVDGSVINRARRRPYANTKLVSGTVIGCAIVLGPPAYRLPDPRSKPELHPFIEAGLLCDPERPPKVVFNTNSFIEFLIDGKRYGPAATDIAAGTYHPCVSLYMGAQCRINLGPEFIHPPPPLPETAQKLTGFSVYHPAYRLPRPDF